ncbi:hypothetical protein IWQ60_005391 [Tieghemiomyces parasiticus]|uniref:HMG box domain-containing protein n=1 Tax=Tieghemiomyces parasiticus TaxID=78921 RepID=A0A9W8A721_9FUNG|nr:hypothetical protein IWQ60_005391 [Tieghemiomyces parasiticus]
MSVSNLNSLLDTSNGLPSPNSMSSEQDFAASGLAHHHDGSDHHHFGRDGASGHLGGHPTGHPPAGFGGMAGGPGHHLPKSEYGSNPYGAGDHKEGAADGANFNTVSHAGVNFPVSSSMAAQHGHGMFNPYDRSQTAGFVATHEFAGDSNGHLPVSAGYPATSMYASAAAGDANVSRAINPSHYGYSQAGPATNVFARHDSGHGSFDGSIGTPSSTIDTASTSAGAKPEQPGAPVRAYSQMTVHTQSGAHASGDMNSPTSSTGGTSTTSAPATPLIAARNTYKRFRNPFIFYVNEMRKKHNPTKASIKNREFVQMMSKEWKQLPEEDKKPYQDMAKADRARYDRDVELHGRIPPRPAKSSIQNKNAGAAAYSAQGISPLNFTDWRTIPHDMASAGGPGQPYAFMGRESGVYQIPMDQFKMNAAAAAAAGVPPTRPGEPGYDHLVYNYQYNPAKFMSVASSLPNSMPNTPGLPTPGHHTPTAVSDLTPPPAVDHRTPSHAAAGYLPGHGAPAFSAAAVAAATASLPTPNSNIPSPQHLVGSGNASQQPTPTGRHGGPGLTTILPNGAHSHHDFYASQGGHPSALPNPTHGATPAINPTTGQPMTPHHPPSAGGPSSAGANYAAAFSQANGAAALAAVNGQYHHSHAAALAAAHGMNGLSLHHPAAQGHPQAHPQQQQQQHPHHHGGMVHGMDMSMLPGGMPGMMGPGGLSHMNQSGQATAALMAQHAHPQPPTAASQYAEAKLSRTRSIKAGKRPGPTGGAGTAAPGGGHIRSAFAHFIDEERKNIVNANAAKLAAAPHDSLLNPNNAAATGFEHVQNVLVSSGMMDADVALASSSPTSSAHDGGNGRSNAGDVPLSPSMSNEDFIRHMAFKWQRLSPSDKRHYDAMAEQS